ncbi:hypothetical protein MN116_007460 [Schistosoma mekongi]|uniref:RNA methyltransferase n=1 Tax=Schistosoma mekongi TaxID=38744 RepID=A0AAE2D3L8_SCHME|nr:hypothetical protein MN116_007460 [Schistosoma mekongi]
MRHLRGYTNYSHEHRVSTRSCCFSHPRGVSSRHPGVWYPHPTISRPSGARNGVRLTASFPNIPGLLANQIPLLTHLTIRPQHIDRIRAKRGQSFTRSRFLNRRKRNLRSFKSTLNPNDPLNLQDLMKETERRRVEGLSPLRGDSRMNTPAASVAGDVDCGSPQIQIIQASSASKGSESPRFISRKSDCPSKRQFHHLVHRRPLRTSKCYTVSRRTRGFIPITGNYCDYYRRRDPNDRLSYLMPEWFVGKDVADYGCHNGTLTFGVLEKFPEIKKIDAFDCDAELIANAQSMQREKLRWDTGSNVRYEKINFQVANWIDESSTNDEPEYDTIMAFSVTKWIHLNHGDPGLMRFFRRAFNCLKPGGHLILEPQPKSSYKRTRLTAKHRSIYESLKINPSNLEPLLVDLGFSYFDTIKAPRPNEPFRRKIILCSKSYGATPASIRNDFRSEVHNWQSFNSPHSPHNREPPPVCYLPQTPVYNLGTPFTTGNSPTYRHLCVSSTVLSPSVLPNVSPLVTTVGSMPTPNCEPDSTSYC